MKYSIFAALLAASVASSSRAAEDDYKLQIGWDKFNQKWNGMVLTNLGRRELTASTITLNGREDCILRPYNAEELAALEENIFGKALMMNARLDTGSVFVSTEVAQPVEPVTMRVGDRIALGTHPNCKSVIRARVATDIGDFELEFSQPFSWN